MKRLPAVVTTATVGRAQQPPTPPTTAPAGGRMVFHRTGAVRLQRPYGLRVALRRRQSQGMGRELRFWRVEDGASVGESTPTNPSGNNYIVYRDLVARDFTLKFEIKVEGNGGSRPTISQACSGSRSRRRPGYRCETSGSGRSTEKPLRRGAGS